MSLCKKMSLRKKMSVAMPARTLCLTLLAGLALAGCGGGGGSDGPAVIDTSGDVAVIATAASDFSSGAVELIDVDKGTSSGSYHPTISDIGVSARGEHYYLYERYNADSVKKVDLSNPGVFEWDYSTNQAGDSESSNPYTLVFASDEKAYLMRYGSAKAWIVDPTARTQGAFKIGELDLSAYIPADSTGVPNMAAGAIVDGKLFIAMQRLDSSYQPTNTGYVAVFDTETDQEIDTGMGENGLKGIPLIGHNPMAVLYHPDLGLLIQNQGGYTPDYTGGIDVIDPETYAIEQRLDDNAQTGLVGSMVVVDQDTGFYLAYSGWQDIALKAFNPSTGDVGDTVAGLSGKDLRALALGPQGNLWIGDATSSNPGLRVVEVDSGNQRDFIATTLLPIDIAFAKED